MRVLVKWLSACYELAPLTRRWNFGALLLSGDVGVHPMAQPMVYGLTAVCIFLCTSLFAVVHKSNGFTHRAVHSFLVSHDVVYLAKGRVG